MALPRKGCECRSTLLESKWGFYKLRPHLSSVLQGEQQIDDAALLIPCTATQWGVHKFFMGWPDGAAEHLDGTPKTKSHNWISGILLCSKRMLKTMAKSKRIAYWYTSVYLTVSDSICIYSEVIHCFSNRLLFPVKRQIYSWMWSTVTVKKR